MCRLAPIDSPPAWPRRVRNALLTAYARTAEHPGKYRIVRWLGRHGFPREGVIATIDHGVRLHLHPRDWIEYLLLRGDAYEPHTLAFLRRNLRSGDTALLAGINFGLHVVVAAAVVGSTGRIVGVDPQPEALLKTAANLRLNGLQNRVQLVSAGLAAEPGMLPMAWSSALGNAGAASFFDSGESLLVSVTPLNRLASALEIRAWRLLLLDVEGFEPKVLAGLAQANSPEIMIVEVQPPALARAGTTPAVLLDQIRELGYELFDLHGRGVSACDPDLVEFNVVALRPGASVQWMD